MDRRFCPQPELMNIFWPLHSSPQDTSRGHVDTKSISVGHSHSRMAFPEVSTQVHLEEVGALCSWHPLGGVQMLKFWKGPESPPGGFEMSPSGHLDGYHQRKPSERGLGWAAAGAQGCREVPPRER